MIERQAIYYFLSMSVALHMAAAVAFKDWEIPRPAARQLPVKLTQIHLVVTPVESAAPEQTEPVVKEKAEPLLTTKAGLKPKPTPKAKPKQVKREVTKRPRPVVKQKQTPRLVSAPPSTNKVVKTKDVAPVTDEALQRDRYLAIILEHIDKHKYYPRTARRRGSEGVVHISFVLLHSGEIRSLQVSGENRNLCKAAKSTMREALPLPSPPEGITFPMSVEFGMKYQLN